MIDQATRTAAEQLVADIHTVLRTTLERMLRAGAPQLEAMAQARDWLIERFRLDPLVAANVVRGTMVKIAEALGVDVDPTYRARVLEALRDVHREGEG